MWRTLTAFAALRPPFPWLMVVISCSPRDLLTGHRADSATANIPCPPSPQSLLPLQHLYLSCRRLCSRLSPWWSGERELCEGGAQCGDVCESGDLMARSRPQPTMRTCPYLEPPRQGLEHFQLKAVRHGIMYSKDFAGP